MRRSPTCIASSTRPASASPSTSSVSASARCSRSLSSSTARRSVSIAVASAPRPSADRPDSISKRTGPVRVAGLDGQVRGQITRLPGQSRVSRLQRGERAGGEGDPPGRQQLGGHRLPGQHVPEPEGVGVQASSCAPTPCSSAPAMRSAGSPVAGGSSRQSNCRPNSAAVCSTSRSSSLSAASRDRTPSANERGTPGAASDSSTRNGIPSATCWTRAMTSSASRRQACAHHRGDLAGGQPAERQTRGGAPSVQPGHQFSCPPTRASPRQVATHKTLLGGQVVAQVLQDCERVRVRPVQVFEHQQQTAGPGQTPQQLQHRLAAYRGDVLAVPITPGAGDGGDHRPQCGPPRSQARVVGERAPAQRLQQSLG